jgi:hypothetical protein
LDFLAEVTQHIPDKGEHLVRYYGWYSHRQRGIRANRAGSGSFSDRPSTGPHETTVIGQKTCLTPLGDTSASVRIDRSAVATQKSADGPRPGSISTWAMLIKRVYEADPLECPCCGGRMKIVSFIERRQTDVIERILQHCGLWEGPLRTRASARSPPAGPQHPTAAADELELIIDGDFLESERRTDQPAESASCSWCSIPTSSNRPGQLFSGRSLGCDRGAHRPQSRCAPTTNAIAHRHPMLARAAAIRSPDEQG